MNATGLCWQFLAWMTYSGLILYSLGTLSVGRLPFPVVLELEIQ